MRINSALRGSPKGAMRGRARASTRLGMVTLTLSVVLFVLSAAALLVAYRTRAATVAGPIAPHTPYHLQSVITQGAVAMTVHSVRYDAGSGAFAAPAGQQYAIVHVTIAHRPDAPIQILPSVDTYLKDDYGTVYYMAPFNVDTPLRAGELLPADTIQGDLSYRVSTGQSLRLFADATWSGGVIPVLLQEAR